MTIREFIDLDANAKRAMTFADIRAIVEPLHAKPLAEVKRIVAETYGDDTRVRIGRTRVGIIKVVLGSMFDLKENCDRNR